VPPESLYFSSLSVWPISTACQLVFPLFFCRLKTNMIADRYLFHDEAGYFNLVGSKIVIVQQAKGLPKIG
jgi:hypothetical protein